MSRKNWKKLSKEKPIITLLDPDSKGWSIARIPLKEEWVTIRIPIAVKYFTITSEKDIEAYKRETIEKNSMYLSKLMNKGLIIEITFYN